jgi:hypothetical protein
VKLLLVLIGTMIGNAVFTALLAIYLLGSFFGLAFAWKQGGLWFLLAVLVVLGLPIGFVYGMRAWARRTSKRDDAQGSAIRDHQ